jgi:arylsulfatase A-like enzyme
MKFFLLTICVFITSITFSQNPNIVVILVDDAGNKDWGFQGSTISKTPNIDRLASEGTIFSQGYVTNSVCAPSRAGMITGQYQNKFGFEYNIVDYAPAPYHALTDVGLDVGVKTMGNYLQELGYTTGMFGKWHLGEEEQHRPNVRGFDHFYGLLRGARQYNKRETLFNKKLLRNNEIAEPTDDNFYITDLLTDEALTFISDEVDAAKPFLAFMSYTAPHSPFQAKPEDKAVFDRVPGLTEKQKHYYGMIKSVDDNVQRIVNLLKEKNAYDNTLFVFLSDNGGVSLTNNGEFRGTKSSEYEGGLRVPFFMTWKNQVPKNTTYNKQVISLDLAATFIKAAGGDLNKAKYNNLDGKDLVSAANNTSSTLHDKLFWRKLDFWAVVSDGENKIIFKDNYDDSAGNRIDTVLYNLKDDISEQNNIYEVANNKTSVKPLVSAHKNWNSNLDLPNWIGENTRKKVCDEGVLPKDCEFFKERYKAFFGDNDELEEIKIEAESGVLGGDAENIGTCSGNASGSVVNLRSGTARYDVNVENEGNYTLKVSAVSAVVRNLTININGIDYNLDVVPNSNNEWCLQGGNSVLTKEIMIPLNSGDNTIILRATDMPVSVDYFTVQFNSSSLSLSSGVAELDFNIISGHSGGLKIINHRSAKILNIYNIAGQQLTNYNLPKGLYIIKIEMNQNIYLKKLYLKL